MKISTAPNNLFMSITGGHLLIISNLSAGTRAREKLHSSSTQTISYHSSQWTAIARGKHGPESCVSIVHLYIHQDKDNFLGNCFTFFATNLGRKQ